jgi:hypothetical protein
MAIHATAAYDYFFAAGVFEGNGIRTFPESWGPYGEPQARVEGHSTRRRAVAKVAFAQFLDGSTCIQWWARTLSANGA